MTFTAKIYAQPYLQTNSQAKITEYKITSYIDKEQSEGYDPNIPLFIDPNFTILAELDGSLKFDLNKMEENIIYYLKIRCCHKDLCSNPLHVVIHRRPLPPTPEIIFTGTHLTSDPRDGVIEYKIISQIDPNLSPWYDPNIEPFFDSNITIAVNQDGSLNYDLSEFESGISYSMQIFCCTEYMCGYPAYVVVYKYPPIPQLLNAFISKEGPYGREFFIMTINFDNN